MGILAFAFWACRSAPPPNVLVVTLDTTRADAIGAYDPSRPTVTPRLDALAAEGIRFDRAYTVTPLTIPAHTSLHTGLLPPRHGVRDNGDAFLSDEAETLAERLSRGGWATMAAVGAEVVSRRWGFAQGFDVFDDTMEPHPDRWRVERPAEVVVASAGRWIAEQTDPWFVWVHLFDAHAPYTPPEPFRGGDPYRGEVAYVDNQLGVLLDGVDLTGTWVFVLADHGEALGDHGESTHGILLYDATTRIPWIVRPPDGGEGRVVDAPVSLVDLYPTVLSLVGLPRGDVDGFDLSGTLRGTWTPGDDRGLYVESLYALHHYGWAPQRAWVDGTHKLVDSTTPELYTRADRLERDDQSGIDRDRVARMTSDLEAYAATLAPTLRPEVDVDRSALVALGYVTTDLEAPDGPLPDPVARIAILRQVEQARQATQRGDLAGARTGLEAAIAREPALYDARVLLARVEDQLGDSEAALRHLEALLAVRRTSHALALKGAIHTRRRERHLGLPLLEEALALDPYDRGAWNTVLGLTWGTDAFRAALAEALERLPDDVLVHGFEGLFLAVHGDPADAVGPLRAALAAGPHPFFELGLGLAERSLGDDVAAEAAFTEEIRLYPPALAARRALVALYAEQGRYDEQLAELEVVAAREEPSVDTANSRAQALFNLGRYEEARVAVEVCRALDPRWAGCAMLAANVYAKLGRPEDARRMYREALVLGEESRQ